MNEHSHKKETFNTDSKNDSFDLVVDGFAHMMSPSKENIKKIESDQDDHTDGVTLV